MHSLDLIIHGLHLTHYQSYLVTDLMATDLHSVLKAKAVDGQFTQYFMYQILVSRLVGRHSAPLLI